jgi:DNA invertase Pin-like site-specific DNA recombinase
VPEPYLLGYARVSKGDDQSNAAQLSALKRAGCARLFEEAASGGRWDRPVLQELMRQLRPGDVVMVWKLDRLSRSLKDLLHLLERIEAAAAGFRSLTESIDTTTPAGRMLMQMLGSFAEYERAMVKERTAAGLAAARARAVSAAGGPSLRPRSAPTSSRMSCRDAGPRRRWPASTPSASRPSREFSLPTRCHCRTA